jgi:hypothetical protein
VLAYQSDSFISFLKGRGMQASLKRISRAHSGSQAYGLSMARK